MGPAPFGRKVSALGGRSKSLTILLILLRRRRLAPEGALAPGSARRGANSLFESTFIARAHKEAGGRRERLNYNLPYCHRATTTWPPKTRPPDGANNFMGPIQTLVSCSCRLIRPLVRRPRSGPAGFGPAGSGLVWSDASFCAKVEPKLRTADTSGAQFCSPRRRRRGNRLIILIIIWSAGNLFAAAGSGPQV